MVGLSHKDLCDVSVKWLKRHSNGIGCNFAISEIQTSYSGGEQADAFGYRCMGNLHGSWLIEVKTSRSDFLADAKKPHRIDPTLGVGQYRVYVCPEDVIKVDELPEGWGLVYVNQRGHVKSQWEMDGLKKFDERNIEGEQYLMARLISRLGDAEKYNKMLKESSAMSSRAWTQVDRLREQIKSVQASKFQDASFYQHVMKKHGIDINEELRLFQQPEVVS